MPPRAKLNVKTKAAPRFELSTGGAEATPKTTASTTPSCSLKGVELKTLLALIGCSTSGTKPTLVSRFRHDVAAPKLAPAAAVHPRGAGAGSFRQRILSVDMGIRNLAFCVADVEIGSGKHIKSKSKHTAPNSGPPVSLSIVAWERIAVQELTVPEEDNGKQAVDTEGKEEEEAAATEEKECFLPATLSRIAYSLLTRKLLPHAPSTLLIEQQRYRSQGSSAVQEWTYRVNMLEGMLWAVLETLRAEEIKTAERMKQQKSSATTTTTSLSSVVPLPSPHAVSPQRVANFWMSSTPLGRALMASKQPRRSRSGKQSARLTIDKRDKISFVSAWLARSSGSDAVAIPSVVDAAFGDEGGIAGNDVDVAFATPQAAATRDAFLDKMVGKVRGRRRRRTAAAGSAAGAGDSNGGEAGGLEAVQEQSAHHLGTIPSTPEAAEKEEGREAVQQGQHEKEDSGAGTAPSRGGRRRGTMLQEQLQETGQGQAREDGHERQADSSSSSSTTTTTATAATIAQERDIGKLDDLADCLLQAAAWARWEGNRRAVHGLANDEGDGALKRVAAAFAKDGVTG